MYPKYVSKTSKTADFILETLFQLKKQTSYQFVLYLDRLLLTFLINFSKNDTYLIERN